MVSGAENISPSIKSQKESESRQINHNIAACNNKVSGESIHPNQVSIFIEDEEEEEQKQKVQSNRKFSLRPIESIISADDIVDDELVDPDEKKINYSSITRAGAQRQLP